MTYNYTIYQTDTHDYCFMPFDFAMKWGFKGSDYKAMYTDLVEADTIGQALERLFGIHNRDDRPNGRYMRSMSMSDVVTINDIPYYCDRFGWSEVPADRWGRR